jgi:hypothetical protein
MKIVWAEIVKIVNFTKSRPLNSRIFSALCEEMGSGYQLHNATTAQLGSIVITRHVWFEYSHCAQKIYYSVLTIPSSFHHVCVILCGSRDSIPSRRFCKDKLNLLFQDDYRNYLGAWKKMESLLRKTESWRTCVEKCHRLFSDIDYLNERESYISDCFFLDIMRLAQGAQQLGFLSFLFTWRLKKIQLPKRKFYWNIDDGPKEYFPHVVGFQWLRNPFIFPLIEQGLSTKQHEELVNIWTDTSLKDTQRSFL